MRLVVMELSFVCVSLFFVVKGSGDGGMCILVGVDLVGVGFDFGGGLFGDVIGCGD